MFYMRNINIDEENKEREKIHIDNVFATEYQHMVIFVPFYISRYHVCVSCKSIKYENSWKLQTYFGMGIFILISRKITWARKKRVDLVRSSTLKYNRKLSYFPLKWGQKREKKATREHSQACVELCAYNNIICAEEWCQSMWKKQRHLIKQFLIQYTQQLTLSYCEIYICDM